MKKTNALIAALAVAVLTVACSSQKEPATRALESATATLAAFRDEAARYVPDQLASVEATIAGLRDTLAKGDYKAVMAAEPGLNSAISSLSSSVDAKRSEIQAATTQWNALASDLPNMVSAIQSRVDVLQKSKRLPSNLSKESFASATAGLDAAKSTWNDANAAFNAGNVSDAVALGEQVRSKATEVMGMLGMSAS